MDQVSNGIVGQQVEQPQAVFSGEENGTVIAWDMTRGLQLAVVWCGASAPWKIISLVGIS